MFINEQNVKNSPYTRLYVYYAVLIVGKGVPFLLQAG